MNVRAIASLLVMPYEYMGDSLRALRWSKASPLCPKNKQLYYDIMLLAHTVEKGLSVPEPRPLFGEAKINELLNLLEVYDERWGGICLEKSYGCLREYLAWHEEHGYKLDGRQERIQTFIKRCQDLDLQPKGGTKVINASAVEQNLAFETALNSRFSCRTYTNQKVDIDTVERIISVALRSPSQCNRQSTRLHYYTDRTKIQNLLKLQGGAEGFRESVNNLFVVTCEFSAWSGAKARSQAYIDGALVSMQILNACQALGLGVCPLNLAITNRLELKVCRAGEIPRSQRLIMMISFGYPEKWDLKVARSERISRKEFMRVH